MMTNKTNNSAAKTNLAKSPQPIKLSGNMATELDMTRASPAQIQQIVQQRELRNNSTMAITGGNGTQSVLSQNNAMSVTKRH